MTAALTDTEIHRAAKLYMFTHRVGYAEALNAVVSVNPQPTNYSAAIPHAQESAGALTETDIHRAAKQYMFTHRVGYAEALKAVASVNPQPSSYSEAVQRAEESPNARLDAAAQRYAQQHHVSYSEALHAVLATFSTASFSEGATPTTAQVLENQQIEIFKVGRHIDDAGVVRNFSEADLAAMVTAYDPALREAPLTIGHPKDNLPAWGWVKGLVVNTAGRLAMNTHQVQPQFAEMANAKMFKKRSPSFYPPGHPNNPKPGNWYLRHVAFLGAQPPAIAGLADVAFSAPLRDGQVSFTA